MIPNLHQKEEQRGNDLHLATSKVNMNLQVECA